MRQHAIANTYCSLLALIGFIVIYVNKENNNKPHYVSWHGLLGSIVSTLMLVNVAATWLKSFGISLNGIKFYYLRRDTLHVLGGYFILILVTVTLVLGLFSNWSRNAFGEFGCYSLSGLVILAETMACSYPYVIAYQQNNVKKI
jgi:cytochrome b-561 domain-containing protein 2